jgi:endoglucanase
VFELIKTLTELDGPVGQEGPVLDYIEPLWQSLGATTERTKIGNLIARCGGDGPKLLLAAHADELCYLVRAVDAGGFIWLANGQGWQRQAGNRNAFYMGQRVKVLARSGPIPGVIATVTGHLASFALPELHELTWDDFWIDTGLTGPELLARGVTPGTRVIWDAETVQMGHHITGKALDDRVPLAVITEVLRRVPQAEMKCTLTLACTVQEEIGLVGAYGLAATERFDAAIAVEIGLAGDIPGVSPRSMPTALGRGPLLVHKDSLVHYDH